MDGQVKDLLQSQNILDVCKSLGRKIIIRKRDALEFVEFNGNSIKVDKIIPGNWLCHTSLQNGNIIVLGENQKFSLIDPNGQRTLIFDIPDGFHYNLTSFGDYYVSISSSERFVLIANLLMKTKYFIDLGSNAGAISRLIFSQFEGMVVLVALVCGSHASKSKILLIHSEQSIPIQTIDLPQDFIVPNQIIVNEDKCIVFCGSVYVFVDLGKGTCSEIRYFTFQGISKLYESDQLVFVESVSNLIISPHESLSFLLSWNLGYLCACKWDNASSTIHIESMDLKKPFTNCILFEDGSFYSVNMSSNGIISDLKIFPPLTVSKASQRDECFLTCNLGDTSFVGAFKQDIPVIAEYRSDQVFRGSVGIWMLRQYNSDQHHSMIAISFVNSTALFNVGRDGEVFENLSFNYGLDFSKRTLVIDNSDVGSFIIQVCPTSVNLCKSNCGEVGCETLATWSDDDYYFSSAVILRDHVFGLSQLNKQLIILQCKTRGSPYITPKGSIQISLDVSVFDVHELDSSSREFLVAIAFSEGIRLLRIMLDETSLLVKEESVFINREINWVVNDMKFSRGPWGPRLICGMKDGDLTIFELQKSVNDVCSLTLLASLRVGFRPVSLLRTRLQSPKYNNSIIAMSGPALLLSEIEFGTFSLESFLRRADYLVRWTTESPDPELFKFIAIEHEALLIFKTSLKRTPRITPLIFDSTPVRKILCLNGDDNFIAISSPYNIGNAESPPTIEVFHRVDEELLFKSALALGDMITCCTGFRGSSEYLAIGTKIGGLGQIRILKIPSNDKTGARRRQSLPVIGSTYTRGVVPQLIFTCDGGFPSPINAMAEAGRSSDGKTYKLIIAAGKELHLMEANLHSETLTSLRNDTWRAEICVLATNDLGFVALSTKRGGLEIYKLIDHDQYGMEKVFASSKPDLIDRLLWCSNYLLVACDRRGFIIFFSIDDRDYSVKKNYVPLNDIPSAICYRESSRSVLVATINGSIKEVSPNFIGQ